MPANAILKLAPANPIFLRVVSAAGRRFRHALIRWLYLGLLCLALIVMLAASGGGGGRSLSDLAKTSTQVFAFISIVQLGMICLLAPVFTAGAITQERDSRTYHILLATPLTNLQIVLGTLLSRMYFVLTLLLAGVPVFAITLFYGGVTGRSIALSFAIATSTGLFMGALAIAIAVFRLGTGKTVFWFYVFNAVFLVGVYLIDLQIRTHGTTILTGLHPFLALESVVSPTSYPTPQLSSLVGVPWLFRWYLAYPAYAYVVLTLSASLLFIIPSALMLRRVAEYGDAGMGTYLWRLFFPHWGAPARRPRRVWANPVAWREAVTRAGTSARGITRWATILIGVAAAVCLLVFYHNGDLTLPAARQVLLGIVLVEFSVALLVATNTSASAVTRERENQTLDLLLATPLTSRYYIWGKLRGLVSFMIPFVAVPTLTILLVVLYDAVTGRILSNTVVYPEVVITLPLIVTTILAWACMLGLQLSLKWSKTIIAVMASVGVLGGVSAVLGVCGMAMLQVPGLGLFVNALSPFTGLAVLIDPSIITVTRFAGPSAIAPAATAPAGLDPVQRLIMFIAFIVAAGIYAGVTQLMYKSMVHNFDMVIRRQHQ